MKRIVASALITVMVLGAVYAAASISIRGVDDLDGGSVVVSGVDSVVSCIGPTGMVSDSVDCSTVP